MVIPIALYGGSSAHALDYESRIIDIAESIGRGQFDQALSGAKALGEKYPGGRLGRLLYADLLLSRAGVLDSVGAGASGHEIEQLRRELAVRWRRASREWNGDDDELPDTLLQAAPGTNHVLYADLAQSRLFVYANRDGRLERVADYYVTQGLNGSGKQQEGDQRTPVGVYHVTGFIDGATLPSRYGPGALPINYPNPMDLRRQRTGHGIWIHGTEPFLVNRAPQASDGCLSLNNTDFLDLKEIIGDTNRTPVVIDHSPRWVPRHALRDDRQQLLLSIDAWRKDWESGDVRAYLSHYDETRFTDGDLDYRRWSARKRAILAEKSQIRVDVERLELIGYPGENRVVLADFYQRFDSRSFRSTMRKQQYWKRGDDGRWRIIFEGRSGKSPTPVMAEESFENEADPSS